MHGLEVTGLLWILIQCSANSPYGLVDVSIGVDRNQVSPYPLHDFVPMHESTWLFQQKMQNLHGDS